MTTYWVKSGGTWSENPGGAGNDPATASTSHASIAAAITAGPPAAGDTILVSDSHTLSTTGTLTYSGGTNASPIECICVQDADSTTRSTGADEATTSGDVTFTGAWYTYGMHFKCSSRMRLSNASLKLNVHDNTILEQTGTAAYDYQFTTNAFALLIGCSYRFGGTGQFMGGPQLGEFIDFGGAFADSGTVPSGDILRPPDNSQLRFFASDFSTKTSGDIFDTPSSGDDNTQIHLDRYKKHATPGLYGGSSGALSMESVLYTGSGAGDEHYEHGIENAFVEVTGDTSSVRNSGASDGVTTYSKLITLNSAHVVVVHIADLFIDIASNKTLTVELAQYDGGGAPTALTHDQFNVFAISPDTTDEGVGVLTRSTSIATSTVRWDDSGGTEISSNITKQKVSVTISGASGVEGPVSVYAVVKAASGDAINVCPLIDVA